MEAHGGQPGKGRRSRAAGWDKPIRDLLEKGLTPRLIYQQLREEKGFDLSESAITVLFLSRDRGEFFESTYPCVSGLPAKI
jgi:hypothetical protein